MQNLLPSKVFFTRGIGRGRTELQSFENALRSAGIAQFNIVSVSSILPPRAEIISKDDGLKLLNPGQILFTVLARNSSNELNRMISSAIGYAVPSDRDHWGYLSEHHAYGETENEAGYFAEELAARMLASTMGLEEELKWDDSRKEYVLENKILTTRNIASTTVVLKKDEWTTVVAAAVLIIM
ncbi:pyruvoyl-dependent arginine decarboxylase [Picrophilus oshimae]|uniref:Pyruvoyl-dependent arginine decarboxylase n=1 Tax=Picrophilus torridus (strain ATCC 700027 / DSM 9790 / JCM 10055 / NBRC 100828 / KAW 2/3) TaxID=1122961 RepID=A0A8G2FX99_PICTO|nr:arginine decarboxylase, pyruvoyl-dependent [Picrophilus oshimae]SMD31156.1 arginine decarboxylase [Picrophilus oshimae DSM 9789]